LVTDCNGDEYQRIEYTPYGETWIDLKTQISLIAKLPYKFSAKELDEETGLYYYGARYLDPRMSRWISADPAMNTGEYFPVAPVDDNARRHNQNLPGMGGIFNHINGNLYAYASNNPIKYTDPDGRDVILRTNNKNHPKFEKNFNIAINYLEKSKFAKQIINKTIKNSDVKIIIYPVDYPSDEGHKNGEINWSDTYVPYNHNTGYYNSASIILFHELLHAWIDLTEDGNKMFSTFKEKNKEYLSKSWERIKDAWEKSGRTEENFYEESFVTALEGIVAEQLGETRARKKYTEFAMHYRILVETVIKNGKVNIYAD
ncbi:MAG: RHS repeat-associated core domain-containing protein, partial [Treponema sp.]|nr:RHS repeat-associated core domain-containing protein [Treponema sp.]